MPCRYDPSPEEIAEGHRQAARRIIENDPTINRLSVRVDYLQDLIWRLVNGTDTKPSDAEIASVLSEQERHRQDDLDRLAKVFSQDLKKHRDKLKKVLDADPSKPLEPQLGFDPDKY